MADPAARDVEDRLYRALAVLRVIVTLNMIGLTVWRRDSFERPAAAVVAVLVVVVWTAVALVAYERHRSRTTWLLVADLVVAVSAIGLTPWMKGPDFDATLPGFWVMGVLLAWAVRWHWRGGLAAGAALVAVDVVVRPAINQTNYGNIFLLLLGGAVVGFMVQSLQQMAVDRARAERVAAAAAERTRLARAVHDGVLQVLSLVQRRGLEAGGELAELGRLAGEQEAVLRSLIRNQDAVGDPRASRTVGERPGAADLSTAVSAALPPSVTFVAPGDAVLLPQDQVLEVVAAVGACLDNVRRHVGPDAPAWVMVEETAEEIRVSVRDEGPGIPTGRLDQAAGEGRLGVSESICGRMRDLGGRAELHTGAEGTEWELILPTTSERT